MADRGTAVTVLTPNGRRQVVKVSPNTPLLQVLEEVCKKHGFNPDDHGLKFQRTVIDLTLQWRFANLPNNAKLEMVTSTRKQAVADSQVRIALQMEDGSRLQGSFSCGQSLWELLTHFPQTSVSTLSETGCTPVCVYMRDEVSGEEALKETTLKSLGLTAGSAIVRFLLKKNTPGEEQDVREVTEIVAMPIMPVATETTSNPSAVSHPETSPADAATKGSDHGSPMETANPLSSLSALKEEVQKEEVPKSQDAVRPKVPLVGSKTPEEDVEEAGPSGLNAHHSSSSSSIPSAAFIPFSGGGQRLGGLGVAAPCSTLSSLTAAVESPKAKKAKSSCSSSAKHKAPASQAEEEIEYLEPVDRESLIYHLDTVSSHSEDHDDLPDGFFEVTMDDVRKRFAQLKSERKFLEEAPLMTKSLREAQMKEKMDRYPKVVLRVQFPDRHVLQGFFRPLETVGALRLFVRSHLEDPQLSFYLFITPPKTILSDPSASLFQADLCPGALVYFGSDVKTDYYIKRELLESCVSALQANESVASCVLQSPTPSSGFLAPELPLLPPEPSVGCREAAEDEQDPSTQSQAAKPTRSDPGKVPKWLKLPGKK